MLIWLRLTQNVILPVVSSKVREGHRVLDVDSELLRVLQDGGLAGELLVVLHRAPGGDLAVITSGHEVLETLAWRVELDLAPTLEHPSDNSNSPTSTLTTLINKVLYICLYLYHISIRLSHISQF